jgi:penicillin-binding protein 1A
MVGGYDYRRSKFNSAEQARRQVGSAFKPIVFGAALERGYTLADTLFDEPTLFVDPTQFIFDENGEIQVRTRNAAQARRMRLGLIPTPTPYQPHNYYNRYVGKVTLREALAQSKNIVSVKLLNSVGYDHVLDYVARMRLYNENLQPFPSMALGAFEMTLEEMTYAYGTFANSGVRYQPRFVSLIMDAKGRVIEENPAKGEQIISPSNAYLVTQAMKSVIFGEKGSGRRAQRLGYPHLAGKTGTTNDYADAWFIGFSPNIAAGVWVGRDLKHPIGRGRSGGATALPIWVKFFGAIKDRLPDEPFTMPEGLVKTPIDGQTGKKFTRDCECAEDDIILETFLKGTEPVDICTPMEKARMNLPWYLQKRTYQFDPETGEMAPNMVIVDTASQQRALQLLDTLREDDIN